MLIDIMGGVISGAACAGDVGNQFLDWDRPQNVGHFFLAMKPDLFVPKDEYLKRMDTLVQRVHAIPTVEGVDEILMPGEKERRFEATRRRTGLPYHPQGSRGAAEGGSLGRVAGAAGRQRALRIEHDMKINDYDIDIVVQGFPGKSVCHGGLGWSTVVLLRAHGRIALIDTGGFSMRTMLIKRLAERGLKPADITDLLLTHSHHDHSVNWTMFPNARIVIGAGELAWSLKAPWGETPVPELYMRELTTWPTLHTAADGEAVFPGITPHMSE